MHSSKHVAHRAQSRDGFLLRSRGNLGKLSSMIRRLVGVSILLVACLSSCSKSSSVASQPKCHVPVAADEYSEPGALDAGSCTFTSDMTDCGASAYAIMCLGQQEDAGAAPRPDMALGCVAAAAKNFPSYTHVYCCPCTDQ